MENELDSNIFVRMLGSKQYELTNHLGNVLATVSHFKISYETSTMIPTLKASSIKADDSAECSSLKE